MKVGPHVQKTAYDQSNDFVVQYVAVKLSH